MKKVVLMLLFIGFILNAEDSLIIHNFELVSKQGDTINLKLNGKKEFCEISVLLSYDKKSRVMVNPKNCKTFINSKQIDIICTKKKSICKTETEVNEARKKETHMKKYIEKMLPIIQRDLGDESKLKCQGQITSDICSKPKDLNNTDVSNLSIPQQRDLLRGYTDK